MIHSWHKKIFECLDLYQKYVLIAFIFVVFILYQGLLEPSSSLKNSINPSSVVNLFEQSENFVVWDITNERPDKFFSQVLDTSPGDWYRIGVFMTANQAARLDISLETLFDGDVPIGSVDIQESNSEKYYERIFLTSAKMISDVKFKLHNDDVSSSPAHVGIKLTGFKLSRLNVRNKSEAARLAPTVVGSIKQEAAVLLINEPSSDRNVLFRSQFVADTDFIKSVRIGVNEKLRGSSYELELQRKVVDKNKESLVVEKKALFNREDLVKKDGGLESLEISFPVKLKNGCNYVLLLKEVRSNLYNPIPTLLNWYKNDPSEIKVGLISGHYVNKKEGVALLRGARVEDIGGESVYSYFPNGDMVDYFDLFDVKGRVWFDEKKRHVIAEQKKSAEFTYQFFTLHPFEKFVFSARQIGKREGEVKLEYSIDGVSWVEILPLRTDDGYQVFSLVLSGANDQDSVYLRVRYNGEERKTGSFGLEQVFVRAQLIR